MSLYGEIWLAMKGLRARKLRSFLTVIGIVVGTWLISSLFILGDSFIYSIEKEFKKLGEDKIFVFLSYMKVPKGPFGDKEVKEIERLDNVEAVCAIKYTSTKIIFRGKEYFLPVFSYDPEKEKRVDLYREEYIKYGKKNIERGEVILGYEAARMLCKDVEDCLGRRITIRSRKFRIAAIMMLTGEKFRDVGIFMYREDFDKIFPEAGYGLIIVKVKDTKLLESTVEDIREKLKEIRGAEDFDVVSAENMARFVTRTLSLAYLFVIGVSSFSIVVGAIGVMNTMFTSVLERIKIIGVLKSIGATSRSVFRIFLIEAILLSIIGGLIGSILSIATSFIVEKYIQKGYPYFVVRISFKSIIVPILISVAAGAAAGAMPARKAASIEPAEALRYE